MQSLPTQPSAPLTKRLTFEEIWPCAVAADLTDREIEIMVGVAKGFSNKEIAGQFTLSVKTIEKHRTNLIRKLKDISDAEYIGAVHITHYALAHGYVDPLFLGPAS